MGDMVERVARVLEPQAWAALGLCDTLAYKNRRTSSLRKARAAIEAMRDATTGMVDKGGWAATEGGAVDCDGEFTIYPMPIWRAMIDAALCPTNENAAP